jgi:hypothetical protein
VAVLCFIYAAINDYMIKRNGVETVGIVMYESVNTGYRSIFHPFTNPIVTYSDSKGKYYTISDCGNCHKIGDRVPVIYDPNNPKNALINTKSSGLNYTYYSIGFIVFFILSQILMRKNIL